MKKVLFMLLFILVGAHAVKAQGLWGISGHPQDNAKLIIKNSTVHAKGQYGAVCDFNGGITIENSTITTTSGGKVQGSSIVDSQGNMATEVIIDSETEVSYDLFIGGIQVTNKNKNNLGELLSELSDEAMEQFLAGEMDVTFDGNKTLTLKGAIIAAQGTPGMDNGYGAGIYSEIDGLIIEVKGDNDVRGFNNQRYGVYLNGNTTIRGDGKLLASGYNGVYMGTDGLILTIEDDVTLSAIGSDGSGLRGASMYSSPGFTYLSTLNIRGNSLVRAKSSKTSAITDWEDFVLENHAITSPTGAYWNTDTHELCYSYGTPVINEWVIIKKYLAYDLNNDGKISTADIQVIINEMKKPQASQNMKYDLNNDGKISTADIQVIINEMKK